ncbi:MAG TPA: hypothetical protein V6C69_02205 [Trichormus sp.]|jgi:hypothetical protein
MTDLDEARRNMERLREALKNKTEPREYGAPEVLVIDHDDYDAQYVGRTADGRQFFLTTPFLPARDPSAGNEFVALFLFDGKGDLLEAKIDEFGPRAMLDLERRKELKAQRMAELGKVSFERIAVKPFFVEGFGQAVGLIPFQYEKDNRWYVVMLPGNYMSFGEPWDYGHYDT